MASKGSPKERISRIFKRSSRSGSKGNGEAPDATSLSNSSPQSAHDFQSSQRQGTQGSSSAAHGQSRGRQSVDGLNQSHQHHTEKPVGRSSAAAEQLPHIQHNSDLSKDFESLTFDTRLNEGRHSVNIADRNISNPTSTSPLHSKTGQKDLRESIERERPLGPRDPPAPHSADQPRRSVNDARNSRDFATAGNVASSRHTRPSGDRKREAIPRSSLDKPLPETPSPVQTRDRAKQSSNSLEDRRNFGVKDSAIPIDLNGIVDLTNTADTTLQESWAPAVTHETIVEEHRYIREEQITREIHTHDVYHRILPVIDIEVLPARHFIPVEGGYAEIAEEELPGRVRENVKWAISEFVSKATPKPLQNHGPRQFTARTFEGTEGDYKAFRAPEGHVRTQQTWVHPPTIEEAGKNTGQTYGFHFGSEDPKDDGLRARLPEGNVIGVSEVLAQKLREQHGKTDSAKAASGQDGYKLPPVPAQRELPIDWEMARKSAAKTPDRDALSPRFL